MFPLAWILEFWEWTKGARAIGNRAVFDPITAFHEKIGEPIGHWLTDQPNWDRIGMAIASAFVLLVLGVTVLMFADLAFGWDIFDDSPRCNENGCIHEP